MPSPWSQDLRDRVLAAYDRGMRTTQLSEPFSVSPTCGLGTVSRNAVRTGRTTTLPMGGARIVEIDAGRLSALMAEHPDAVSSRHVPFLLPPGRLSSLCASSIHQLAGDPGDWLNESSRSGTPRFRWSGS